jgi:uncharacterized protein YndB with AHSA1/START domain
VVVSNLNSFLHICKNKFNYTTINHYIMSEIKTKITAEATVNAPVEKVWKIWTTPAHIMKWNNASPDWHTPIAENDLKVGGKFLSRMEAKDGSFGFDFWGIYDEVKTSERITYTLGDDRKVEITFKSHGNTTTVTETFEAENQNSVEMQQAGWQAILNNFKKHAESYGVLVFVKYDITINATAEKTYNTMINKGTYEAWAAAFSPGSHFLGSWEKGTKILFLGPGENGEMGGMVSRIKDNIPNKYVSIEHYGIVENGKERTTGIDVEAWAGCNENYAFEEKDGKTLLAVTLDINADYKDYFNDTWPKALSKLKELSES